MCYHTLWSSGTIVCKYAYENSPYCTRGESEEPMICRWWHMQGDPTKTYINRRTKQGYRWLYKKFDLIQITKKDKKNYGRNIYQLSSFRWRPNIIYFSSFINCFFSCENKFNSIRNLETSNVNIIHCKKWHFKIKVSQTKSSDLFKFSDVKMWHNTTGAFQNLINST